MKTIYFALTILIFGLLSCNKDESLSLNNKIAGKWELEDNESSKTTVEFKQDMTYQIAKLYNSAIHPSFINYDIAFINGDWKVENDQILFVTAQVELPAYDTVSVITENVGLPLAEFYGNIRPNRENVILTPYEPTIWSIDQLTNELLIIENKSIVYKYNKIK